ncbi:unnamed protein product [Brassica oleracea var. botrytis]|uniref:(rape) hypothetical protein n=1 Tax=Brassica napus TaxID=3708 RepID=A0A816LAI4_BRANA|nr:unnamed protein product [Brassica napus]
MAFFLLKYEQQYCKYNEQKKKTDLEPKEKEENPRNRKETEHLQIGIQVKKDWALSWWDQYIILSR